MPIFVQGNSEFTVAMRGRSSAFLSSGEELIVDGVPSDSGPVRVTLRSRVVQIKDGVTFPGDLWIEIIGKGSYLSDILAPYANAAISLLPVLSVSANAAIDDPDIEVAFNSSPALMERDFFQNYIPPERQIPHFFRRVDIPNTLKLFSAIARHSEGERLRRAANQYRLALDSWILGKETLSLAHLWMALEALTPVKLRQQLEITGLAKKDFANSLGINGDKWAGALDACIRKDFLLGGDKDCYEKCKDASDGFEHGYREYEIIHRVAKDYRRDVARYIRAAILELSGLDAATIKVLSEHPYDKPMGFWPYVKYFRGRLVGRGAELAATGSTYPFMRWKPDFSQYRIQPDGVVECIPSDQFTAELGEGISIKNISLEMWKPDG